MTTPGIREDAETFAYDPFDLATRADPYAAYSELRASHPLYRIPGRELWALSRFDDIQAALRDWRHFTSSEGTSHLGAESDRLQVRSFLSLDPPEHDVLRRAVRDDFAMRNVNALEAAVAAQVEELVAAIADREQADLARDLAWPLPTGVVTRLLGVPIADLPYLQSLFDRFMVYNTVEPGDVPEQVADAARALRAYFADALETTPHGLVGKLAEAVRAGALDPDDAVRICIFLMIAGFETTAGLLSNAFLLLALHPEQRAWLARNPAAIPDAVEEVLRFESPIQLFSRVAVEDVGIAGGMIPAGARVLMLIGCANRDERRFPDGDRFDVRRKPTRNLAFGEGIHHCLGALLARLEGRVALEHVLRLMPEYELAGEPGRMPSVNARVLLSLPVELGPRR